MYGSDDEELRAANDRLLGRTTDSESQKSVAISKKEQEMMEIAELIRKAQQTTQYAVETAQAQK